MSGEPLVARVGAGVAGFDAAAWDACAGTDDPFLGHAFLSALEDSGSATAETGWRPLPIAIDGPDGRPAALIIPSSRSRFRSRRCRADGC